MWSQHHLRVQSEGSDALLWTSRSAREDPSVGQASVDSRELSADQEEDGSYGRMWQRTVRNKTSHSHKPADFWGNREKYKKLVFRPSKRSTE